MNELLKFEGKKFSSLYLVEQINLFRDIEGIKTKIQHKSILTKIELEFANEIDQQNILPTFYIDSYGRKQKAYELIEDQVLEILVSEVRSVRKAIIKLVRDQSNKIKIQQLELVQLKIESIEAEKRFLMAQNDRLHDKLDINDLYKR